MQKQQVKKHRSKQVTKSKVTETNRKPEIIPKKELKVLLHMQSFRCKDYGHYSTSKEPVVNNTVQSGLLPTEVILDNAVNISIMRPLLLTKTRDARKQIWVKGGGGGGQKDDCWQGHYN
jgi:hypothetical protein